LRSAWVAGAVLGLVAGGVVLAEVPLAVKLLVGLLVLAVGVLGPLGSVLLAGLLLAAGLLSFVVLLVTSQPGAVGASLGVATLLIAGGATLSLRELLRDRRSIKGKATTVSPGGPRPPGALP